MRRGWTGLLGISLAAAVGGGSAAEPAGAGSSTLSDEVLTRLLEHYGMVDPDAERIRTAFHPDAQLFGVFGGNPVTIPLEAWIERITGDPKPAPDALVSPPAEPGKEWEVLSLENDGNIARVVVRDQFLGVWYTDYLTLMETEQGWRIVNKTFTYEKRP